MARLANDWLVTTPGAQDFAEVYRAAQSDMRAIIFTTMLGTPGFERYAAHAAKEDHGAAFARHWAGIEAAFAGDWGAHERNLRDASRLCARLGVSLANWQQLMRKTMGVVREALFARFGADPERLWRAGTIMHLWHDHALETFIESYMAATHEQLTQSEALFQLTQIGHVIVADDGTFVKANRAFLEMYGIDEAQLGTRRLKSLFEATDLTRVAQTVYPEARRTGHASYDAVHVDAAGATFPVHIEAVRIAGNDLWGHSIYDLSERAQAEALRTRSADLEAENERVREANRIKSEFLANMSHELRTPLNAILGFSELLAAGEVGPLDAQQAEFVQDIHISGKHLLRLINDVLDLSKVEAGKLDFDPEEIDLGAVTQEAVQLSRGTAAERSVTLEVVVDDAARSACLDRGRYQQVLYNYLSNAIKFSPVGGRVLVRVQGEGAGSFRLSVTDRGPGVAPADLKRLFVLFEQLDAGRGKKHAGTGLGLALTRQLVEAQGGTVGVESEEGAGSTFYAVLPLRTGEC